MRTITHLPLDVLTSTISLVDARENGILGRLLFSKSKARRLYLPGGMWQILKLSPLLGTANIMLLDSLVVGTKYIRAPGEKESTAYSIRPHILRLSEQSVSGRSL